jgi:hypothetical protein
MNFFKKKKPPKVKKDLRMNLYVYIYIKETTIIIQTLQMETLIIKNIWVIMG